MTVYNAKEYWKNKVSCLENDNILHEIITQRKKTGIKLKHYSVFFEGSIFKELNRISCNSEMALFTLMISFLESLIVKYNNGKNATIMVKLDEEEKYIIVESIYNESMTIREMILQTKKQILDTYSYPKYGLKEYCIDNNISLDQYLGSNIVCTMGNIENICNSEKYFLCFNLRKDENVIGIDLIYGENTINESLLKAFLDQFYCLVNKNCFTVNKMISNLEYIPDNQKQIIDAASKGKSNTVEKNMLMLFEEQINKTPDAIALQFYDTKWTYKKLDERSDEIGRNLLRLGARPGNCIGMCLNRGCDVVACIIAIWKIGCHCVAAERTDPYERQQFIFHEAKAQMIISNNKEQLVSGIPTYNINEFETDKSNIIIRKSHDEDALAYIIFTSGSTGNPKGVMIEHKSLVNAIQWRKREYDLNVHNTVIQLFSYCFDGFYASLMTPLMSGAKIIILNEDDSRLPIKILNSIKENEVSHFIVVPTLFHELLESSTRSEMESVKCITLAGEVTNRETLILSKTKYSNIELVNEYGPTENTIVTTYFRKMNLDSNLIIGRPIDNVKVRIIDKKNKELPIGIYGELVVNGTGLMAGYINDSNLDNKMAVIEGETYYKTGDMVRWLSDGNIEYKARLDRQIKLNGYRIEMEEISSALKKIKGVKNALVFLIKSKENNTLLVAAIEECTTSISVKKIANELEKKLPLYMIPNRIIKLDKFPVNNSGKADVHKIENLLIERLNQNKSDLPATNHIEMKLCEIWRKMFNINKIGINDNFFSIGGHSIKATHLLTEIFAEFGVDLPLNQIFETPTIAELSKIILLSEQKREVLASPNNSEFYDLSNEQERMYILDQFSEMDMSYNVPICFILDGTIDLEKLELCIKQVINRYDIFNTEIRWQNNCIKQFAEKSKKCIINKHKLDENSSIQEYLQNLILPFDLEKSPLFRINLIDYKGKYYLFMDFHHIIVDADTIAIFITDFCTLYNDKKLKPVQYQYKDYVYWQKKGKSLDGYIEAKLFWKGEIESIESWKVNLIGDTTKHMQGKNRGDRYTIQVPDDLFGDIDVFIKNWAMTKTTFFEAVFVLLLSFYTKENQIVIGSSVSTRDLIETQRMPGPMINTIPLINYIDREKNIICNIKNIVKNFLIAYKNKNLPFNEIVEFAKTKDKNAGDEYFNVFFVQQKLNIEECVFNKIKLSQCIINNHTTKFDLLLELNEANGVTKLIFEYNLHKFSKKYVMILGDNYIKLLKFIINNPYALLDNVDFNKEHN